MARQWSLLRFATVDKQSLFSNKRPLKLIILQTAATVIVAFHAV